MTLSFLMLWALICAIGLGTFLLRGSFIFASGKMEESAWLRRVLRYVPPAIMAALVSSSLLIRDADLSWDAHNYRLLAGLAAGLVAWKTKNVLLTILTGFAVLFLLQ